MKQDKNTNYLIALWARLRWTMTVGLTALVLTLIAIPWNTGRLLIYKVALICFGAVFAHLLRKQLFPYIDLEVLLKNDKKVELADAVKFAGAAILIGLLMYGVIVGLVTGI